MSDKICVKCQVELRVKQNGVPLVQLSAIAPVYLRMADLWHCPECGFEVILGVADNAMCHTIDSIDAEIVKCEMERRRVFHAWQNAKDRNKFREYYPLAAEALANDDFYLATHKPAE